jgi:hypothetical protein
MKVRGIRAHENINLSRAALEAIAAERYDAAEAEAERRALWLYEETGRMEWLPGADIPWCHHVFDED